MKAIRRLKDAITRRPSGETTRRGDCPRCDPETREVHRQEYTNPLAADPPARDMYGADRWEP